MSATTKDISTYSAEVQTAVQDAAGILKVGQSTNQQLIDDFMDKAAELLSAAAALRAAGDNAGAQAKISELIRLGAQVSGDSSTNLDAVMTQLTGVVDKLNGGATTTASSAEGNGNTPPAAYNSSGGGGGGGERRRGRRRWRWRRRHEEAPAGRDPAAAGHRRRGQPARRQHGDGAQRDRGQGGPRRTRASSACRTCGAAPRRAQGLDCSGLTQYAYGEGGLDIPRTSREQDIGAEVPSADQLLPGDLICWEGHVAMYIGNGQIVEAGDPVQVGPLRTTNSGMPFVGFYRPTG